MAWPRTLDDFPSNLLEGDGFSVRLYARYGVRYYEGERELTLMTGIEDATDRYGRSLLIFPTSEVQIFVPNILAWDNGGRLTEQEGVLVIDRICGVFARMKGHYRVIVGDEIYEQIARDEKLAEKIRKEQGGVGTA